MAFIGSSVQQSELVGATGGDLAGVDLMTQVIEGNLALSTTQINNPKQDINGSLIISDSPQVGTFVASTVGQAFVIDTLGYKSIDFTTVTFIGTVLASNDLSRYTATYGMSSTGAAVTTIAAINTNYVFPCTARYIKVTCTAVGALSYTLRDIPYQGNNLNAINGAAVSATTAQLGLNIASIGGTASAGTPGFLAIGSSTAANGQTAATVVTAATPAVTLIKSGITKLYNMAVGNPNTTPVYLKIFNATTVTLGTTNANLNYLIPANSTYNLTISATGISFATGLAIAVTGGIALNNNTAITTGCAVSYTYI